MTRQQVGQFSAVGDNGITYTVKVFRHLNDFPTFEENSPSGDPKDWDYVASVPGENRGFGVQRIGKGKYVIFDHNISLTSTDPKAV